METKLIAFDLDGTLTQHKSPLSAEYKEILDKLSEKYSLLMVGAGQVNRIFKQMGQYPIDIIGNYGLQYGMYNKSTKSMDIVRNISLPCDKEAVIKKISFLREKYGFLDFKGESVEFHPSGCLTFPILGTAANIADKLAFDPDRKKRRAIYNDVASLFDDYCVFVGGSSSFDMAPKPYNKYHALDEYCREFGFEHSQTVFVGDDYGTGGNDESVYKSDFAFICIDNYLDFPNKVSYF